MAWYAPQMNRVKTKWKLNLLNLQDLNGRCIHVDYSVTDHPQAPTLGEYMHMGHRRIIRWEPDHRERGGPYRDSYRDREYRCDFDDRDRYYDRDRIERYDSYAERGRDWIRT